MPPSVVHGLPPAIRVAAPVVGLMRTTAGFAGVAAAAVAAGISSPAVITAAAQARRPRDRKDIKAFRVGK